MLRGIDVSHDQGTINWPLVAKSGVSFAICKASEGITVQDVFFRRNITQARTLGLVPGAYHFFHPNDDAIQQAENFLGQLADTDFPAILALDLEGSGWDSVGGEQRSEMVYTFLDYVEERRGRMMIYVSPAFADEYLQSLAFALYKIWIADYSGAVPPGWGSYSIWQTGQGPVPGIVGPCDLDRFDGDLEALKALAVPLKV